MIHHLISLLFVTHSTLNLLVAASPHGLQRVLDSHSEQRAEYGPIVLFEAATLADTSLSKACIAALATPLECSPYILDDDMLYTWNEFPEQNLILLCTSTCSKSIERYRSEVIRVCANDVYTEPEAHATGYVPGTNTPNDIYNDDSSSLRPIALADYYFLNYNLLCLKDDKSKAFCYSEPGDGDDSTLDDCSSCNLAGMRMHLENAATFDEDLLIEYSSLITSCKTTAAPVTTPSPVFLDPTSTATDPPASAATCSGLSVPAPDKESCDDFAFAHNISTSRLLSINHLIGGCVDWPGESPNLCIEGNCEPYRVKKGDTCAKVARAHGITQTQLLRWNYFIDPYCKNWGQQIGHIICVSDPSGYKPPKRKTPGAGAGKDTTAAPSPTKKTKTKTINLNDLPEATRIPWSATTTSTGFPLASGSVQNCHVKLNNDYGNIPCEVAASAYGIELYYWLKWNPSVLGGFDYVPGNCTLQNNTQYCAIAWDPRKVKPPKPNKYKPAPTGATPNATKLCEYWYVVSEGETCEEVLEENKIPLWALHEWNPSIGSHCEKMQVNAAYCAAGPGWKTANMDATRAPKTNPTSTTTTEAF